MLPVVAFVGVSGSGKTTLLESIIRELKAHGYRVGVAKHAHHLVDLDQPGKDSWRLAQAGSDLVALGTPQGVTLFDRSGQDMPLAQVAGMFAGKVDLLLAEGYKGAPVPKIAVVRAAVSDELPCDPHDLIALVSDVPFALAVPRFSFGQGPQIARFLVDAFSRQGFLLPAWPQLVERHPAS